MCMCMQVTSRGLQQLLTLPALVELVAERFTDDTDADSETDDNDALLNWSYATWQAGLDDLRASFKAVGRTLITRG